MVFFWSAKDIEILDKASSFCLIVLSIIFSLANSYAKSPSLVLDNSWNPSTNLYTKCV